MAFQNQKENILKFYEHTNQALEQHKETYGKLVSKLNEKTGLTNTLTNNLDDFMELSFPDFKQFRNTIKSNDLQDTDISFVYDINKDEYLTNFQLPDKKIIVKQKFKCVLMGIKEVTHMRSNSFNQPMIDYYKQLYKKINSSFKHRINNNSEEIIGGKTIKNHLKQINLNKGCTCKVYCGCNNQVGNFYTTLKYLFENWDVYESKETQMLEMWIDDYFNIYIPSLKTYLVYNYSKFPLYTFYTNLDKLNLYHNHIGEDGIRNLIFNEDFGSDLSDYNIVKSFNSSIGNYQNSVDKRNEFKDLFKSLLGFYKYQETNNYLSQYQDLCDTLEKLSPSSLVITTAEDSMNDEKKIFAQSQRIRELEIANQKQLEEIEYLRCVRTEYIEKDSITSNKLADYQKLLEELNNQLKDEIDKTSIQSKEVLRLKTINIENSETDARNKQLENINKSFKVKLQETEDKLSKIKTLNNTLVDKQLSSHQKVIEERNKNKEMVQDITKLKLDNSKYDNEIQQLKTKIITEQEQNILSKNKIDELIEGMGKENKLVEDDYSEILMSQLKDKNDEIKILQDKINKLNIDIEKNSKEYSVFKSQINRLLNK
jgi:hypothetical protein